MTKINIYDGVPPKVVKTALKNKKKLLDYYFEKYPEREKLGLHGEPDEGYPVLEVSAKYSKEGITTKWLPYKEGLKQIGIKWINYRRVLPDEIVLDCDEGIKQAKQIFLKLQEDGFKFWFWTQVNEGENPFKKAHFQFFMPDLMEYTPNQRWKIKENIIQDFGADPVMAQRRRVVSMEYARHHKRPTFKILGGFYKCQ